MSDNTGRLVFVTPLNEFIPRQNRAKALKGGNSQAEV
ncbi:hypothetical protein D1BOALGB6SA_4926 [Olavius sp. associated proteobacterium Delta 1]|nr:hypothetical protein D1BOALGB6SA_4926 [Olavius sp. associated proteobacterium Delta 1]